MFRIFELQIEQKYCLNLKLIETLHLNIIENSNSISAQVDFHRLP